MDKQQAPLVTSNKKSLTNKQPEGTKPDYTPPSRVLTPSDKPDVNNPQNSTK
jgi:hypothetical protein